MYISFCLHVIFQWHAHNKYHNMIKHWECSADKAWFSTAEYYTEVKWRSSSWWWDNQPPIPLLFDRGLQPRGLDPVREHSLKPQQRFQTGPSTSRPPETPATAQSQTMGGNRQRLGLFFSPALWCWITLELLPWWLDFEWSLALSISLDALKRGSMSNNYWKSFWVCKITLQVQIFSRKKKMFDELQQTNWPDPKLRCEIGFPFIRAVSSPWLDWQANVTLRQWHFARQKALP